MLLTLMVSVSCIDRPEVVLSDDEMIDLLVDVHRSEGLLEMQGSQASDENYQKAVMAAVLAKHGVTREQYDSSLMWYAKHLKLFVRVYSHVEERLNEEHEHWDMLEADAREFEVSEPGDSVGLWTLRDYLVLDARLGTTARFWEMASDSNFQVGDTLRWSLDVSHLAQGQRLLASMSLRIPEEELEKENSENVKTKRRNTPIGTASLLIDRHGQYQFSVVPDSLQLFGSVLLNLTALSPDSVHSPVMIDNISLIRYHRHE